ncbi:UDP binding domain-containing protein [Dactylosporangium sp. CA-152071]|uniref:UDP binding domain-containing protein n=1 Tax=Dactylosporangium sp. CA-152071 TaxID=3239933 RepID=UPI003D8F4E6B
MKQRVRHAGVERLAGKLGVGQAVAFLREVDALNQRRCTRTVDLVRELAGGSLTGVRVAALGAAFKPNSDDICDAPALDVANTLHRAGALVSVFAPAALDNARRLHPDLGCGTSALDVACNADAVVLLTEWSSSARSPPQRWAP